MRLLRLLVPWLILGLTAQAEIRYVIAISIDGGRGDFIKGFIDSDPQHFSNLKRLRALSASTFNARCDVTESITIPNHLGMLTGRPVRQPAGFPPEVQHGYIDNFPTDEQTVHNSGLNPGVYKASIFDDVHDHGLSTAIYLGKHRLEICNRSWDAEHGAPDLTGVDNGTDKIDRRVDLEASDPTVTSGLIASFADSIQQTTLKNFTFVHIADTDYAGHAYGWDPTPGSTYRNTMRMTDSWIGQILDAVLENPATAGHTAIMVTADHGGGTPFITHVDSSVVTNYTIPFILFAPGLPGGSDLYASMENRADPGSSQPAYSAPMQPFRNSDVANISAALLGLPPVPGSLVRAEFKKPLLVGRNGSELTVSWPIYLTGYTLEESTNLESGPWTPVTSNTKESNGWMVHSLSTPPQTAVFFRLRLPNTTPVSMPLLPPAEPKKVKPAAVKNTKHRRR